MYQYLRNNKKDGGWSGRIISPEQQQHNAWHEQRRYQHEVNEQAGSNDDYCQCGSVKFRGACPKCD